MSSRLFKLVLASFVFFALSLNANAYFNPGNPVGFVNDYTDTIGGEQKQSLENKLSQIEKSTGNEIAIVIIKNLQGDTIENFAEKLFKDWGIGKEKKDNGVLILVAKEDREMRIEVGYGLEGALTDAQSNWIINQVMKPAFRNNDFYKGIDEAADKIIAATQGENIPSLSTTKNERKNSDIDYEMLFWAGAFVFMWLSAILGRSKSWWLGGVLGGTAGIIIGLIKGFLFFGLISIAILIPAGLLFDFIVSRGYKEGKARGHLPWWVGGQWSGKKGGFGGFGGGMSGGGGSSGSW